MGSVQPRYSKEEFARRGDAIYEKDILPKLTAKDVGKFLAIDIETGAYEIAADERKAGDKLRGRLPEAQIWMVRIGYASTHRFGGRQVRQELP
ncbi:MAG TPA: hypothetical protein VMS17_25180 [Gemmataceae bacterium]|nr:hypothetical protein [Gemmataceae bacterium]